MTPELLAKIKTALAGKFTDEERAEIEKALNKPEKVSLAQDAAMMAKAGFGVDKETYTIGD